MCVVRDLTCILVHRWCVANDARFVAQLSMYCTYVNKLFIYTITDALLIVSATPQHETISNGQHATVN